jgi:putative salt-induced outer membrane protein YdiY
MSLRRSLVVAVSLSILTSRAMAQDPAPKAPPPPPPPPVWTGAAQASFLKTSGNTDTSVLGLGAEAKYKGTSPWSVSAKTALSRGSLDGEENLRNFTASLRGGRSFNPKTELFFGTDYAEDIYAGIDSRVGGEVGVSQKLSASEPHLLSVELAFGLTHEVRLPARIGDDFGVGRAGIVYKYVISKTADLQNQFNFIANLNESDDWRLTNVAALTVAIDSRFSLKLSYAIAHLNTPPLGKVKTDQTMSAALVAKF